MSMSHGPRRRSAAVIASISAIAVVAACSGGGETGNGSGEPDDGTTLTMWVRAATDTYSEALVEAYNSSHENQIDLTIIPNDTFLQRVGAAAGAGELPDLLASDVIYAPNYTQQGLYADITDRVGELDFADQINPAHMTIGAIGDVQYSVPFKVDSSVIYWNKDLFEEAGLDPDTLDTSVEGLYEQAAAVRELGGDTYGFYFGGACGGCTGYTVMPVAAAAGTPPLNDDGTVADIDNEAFASYFSLYRDLFENDIAPAGVREENGATWAELFLSGNVGIFPGGNSLVVELAESDFEWGVTAITSPDGATDSTFVGGDIIGVSSSSDNEDQAWNFLEWMLDEETQVEIIAQSGELPVRSDLADNEYTSADPRIAGIAANLENGYTPYALPFGEIFNDPNGPWVTTLRGAIFGDDPETALADGQQTIQEILDRASS